MRVAGALTGQESMRNLVPVRRNALIAEPRHAFMHEIDCRSALSTGRGGLDTQSDSGVLARRDVRRERGASAIENERPPIAILPVIAGENRLRLDAAPLPPAQVRDVNGGLEDLSGSRKGWPDVRVVGGGVRREQPAGGRLGWQEVRGSRRAPGRRPRQRRGENRPMLRVEIEAFFGERVLEAHDHVCT